jgi:hypothetical protein
MDSRVGPFQPSVPGKSHIPVGWSTPWQMAQVEGEISVVLRPCMGVVYVRLARESRRWNHTSSSRMKRLSA